MFLEYKISFWLSNKIVQVGIFEQKMCSKQGILSNFWVFLADFREFNVLVLVIFEKSALHSEGY